MKTLFILTLTLLITQLSFAQDSTMSTLRPVAGQKVMTFGIINNSAFWAYKKYKSDKLAFRFGINGSYNINLNSKTQNTTSYSHLPDSLTNNSTGDGKSTTFSIGLIGGFQKALINHKRIEPYMGLDLSLAYSYINISRSNISNNSGSTTFEEKSPLQLNLFILPLAGLNYYITPGFAIGAEYRLSILNINYSTNGESTTVTTSPSNQITTSKNTQDGGAFAINGNFTGTGFITLTFLLK